MRKMREVLRLRHALSLSYREIGEALGVSKTAAGEIVRRAEVIGLSCAWQQADCLSSKDHHSTESDCVRTTNCCLFLKLPRFRGHPIF